MRAKEQLALLDDAFRTVRPANSVFCHQEFLEKLSARGNDSVARRVSLLLERMSVDLQRLHFKSTSGAANRGWRRSRLGGNQGSHYYAWWAPRGAAPLQEADAFRRAPEGSVFLRDIRHHDDHSPLVAHSFEDNYLPVSVREIRDSAYAPAPLTQAQSRFASARLPVRLLKGHPGSGKTTALWHAADAANAKRILYVTYSRDLAALAKDYFDRYCSSAKVFHVVTFPALMRALAGSDEPLIPEDVSRRRFSQDLAPLSRMLGAWTNHQAALYDEMHAHLIGGALPEKIGRFAASDRARAPDKAYKEWRTRSLGPPPVAAVVDVASRLERDHGGLAERYFPELALAWKVSRRLHPAKGEPHVDLSLLNFDCIAVDETQDLAPIEAYALIELAHAIRERHRAPFPLLLAGDEAQTVRPTDFEWAWLNDLLHARLGTPAEYKLGANLRSPRRIASLVNRVWDLYGLILKSERPSGSGSAEIEDDANDQVLHCTAAPGPDLDELFRALSVREGLAIVSLEDAPPAYVPDAVKPAVLSAREAKGLDFHSVCILDGGRHIERVERRPERVFAVNDIEDLRKRLAIDQLRVAVSRPAERLIWLDVSPSDAALSASVRFLNGPTADFDRSVVNSSPAALLKELDEEQLDIEERIQRCTQDARQYLGIRPEMAWSRAQQAVALLGEPDTPTAVSDPGLRNAAFLTLAEICFTLGFRKTKFPPEMGRLRPIYEASQAAARARRFGLSNALTAIGKVRDASLPDRQAAIFELAQTLPRTKDELEPWVLLEIAPSVAGWVDELEAALYSGHNAAVLIRVLPGLYSVLGLPDAAARLDKLRKRAIQLLMKDENWLAALEAVQALPERQPKLEANCREGLRQYREAAVLYREADCLKEALNCYRAIPDVAGAIELLPQLGSHPAAESLAWMARLQTLVSERPPNFTRVVNAAEKKQLEQLLEQSLGVTRKKPVKAAAKKTARKIVPKKRPPL